MLFYHNNGVSKEVLSIFFPKVRVRPVMAQRHEVLIRLVVGSMPLEEMKYLLKFIFPFFALVSRLSAALSSGTQHAIPPEFGRKWGTECLNTRFPLPTLLCAGYSVKLILKKRNNYLFQYSTLTNKHIFKSTYNPIMYDNV